MGLRRIDVCGLPPPEPLERVVEALTTLESDDALVVVIHREPVLLYSLLARHRFHWETTLRDDGVFEVRIERRP
ncbi:MAG: DUF2249 domain-containing protein [Myxococcales bacterium]|jgi:uncharacterized protein (DUF2249 family)